MDDVFALTGLAARPGAPSATVGRAERLLGVDLPDDYRAFLLASNGLEGFVGPDAYLMLYRAEEVSELQLGSEWMPGVVIIGSDGGGEAFGFMREDDGGILYVRAPFIGADDETMDRISPTLYGLVERLRAGDFA